MKIIKLTFVFTFAILLSTLMGQVGAMKQVRGIPTKNKIKPNDPTLPKAPLILKNHEKNNIDLKKIYKLTNRFFTAEVENTSEKDIAYDNIIVNCNCTSIVNKVPPKGVIKAHSTLKLLLRLNAASLNERRFIRMIRFELPGYQHFQLNFFGELSSDLEMTFADDPKELSRKKITIGFIDSPSTPWTTSINLYLKGDDNAKLKVQKLKTMGKFIAAQHNYNDKHIGIELHAINPLKIGTISDAVLIEMLEPAAPAGQKNLIVLPIVGICGTQIEPSEWDIFNDPKTDGPICEKTLTLARIPFIDEVTIANMVRRRENPYTSLIKPLSIDELTVPKVPGVEFTLKQEKGGVVVTCKLDRSKLTEQGVTGVFAAKDTKSVEIRFAILSEKERAEIKAQKEKELQEEKEEEAFQKEQEELAK